MAIDQTTMILHPTAHTKSFPTISPDSSRVGDMAIRGMTVREMLQVYEALTSVLRLLGRCSCIGPLLLSDIYSYYLAWTIFYAGIK